VVDRALSTSAVGPAYWLNDTLQAAQNQVSTVVVDYAAARQCEAPNRVLPELCRELRCGTPSQQVRTLQSFLHHVHTIHRCVVEVEDCASLFTVLFLLMRRHSGALTKARNRLHNEASDLAFCILCRLFRRPAQQTGVLLRGLEQVLRDCACAPEDFVRRTELPRPVRGYSQAYCDSSDSSDSEGRTMEIANQRQRLQLKLHALSLRRQEAIRPPEAPPPEHISFLQSFNCIEPNLLGPGDGVARGPFGDLNEQRFHTIFTDFAALDIHSKGTISINEIGQGRAEAMVGGINIASHDFFRTIDKEGKGYLSLEELLRYWFPCVPQRFIRRRVLIALEHAAHRSHPTSPLSPDSGSPAPAKDHPPEPGEGEEGKAEDEHPHSSVVLRSLEARAAERAAELLDGADGERQAVMSAEACMATEAIGSDCEFGVPIVCDDWQEGIKLKDGWHEQQIALLEMEPEELVESPPAAVNYQKLSRTPTEKSGKSQFADLVKQAADDVGQTISSIASQSVSSPVEGAPSASGQLKKLFTASTHAAFSKKVARRVKEDFETLDIDGSGEVTFKEIQLNGSAIGGVQVSREMFLRMDRDRSGAVTLVELCRELFSRVPLSEIKATLRDVEAESVSRLKERMELKTVNESDYEQSVERRRVDLVVTLDETASGIAQVLQELEDLDVEERQRAQSRALRRMRREERRAKNRDPLAIRNLKPCVPVVLTCVPFPASHASSGIRVTKPDLCLDWFLEKGDTSAAASQLLHTLDASGVDVRAFTEKPSAAVPGRMTYECKVFRDFACLHQKLRPARLSQAPGTMRWVRFVTNIRRRSSVKFRFLFEGHNTRRDLQRQKIRRCTVSTVVSGGAGFARWPDNAKAVYKGLGGGIAEKMGIDAVHHQGDGLTYAAISYSSEQTVQILLGAPDLTDLALSVTAWLANNDSGGMHALTGRFETDEECEAAMLFAKSKS